MFLSYNLQYNIIYTPISPVNAISKLTRITAQSPEEDYQNENDNQQRSDNNVIYNVKSCLVIRRTWKNVYILDC